MTRLRIAPIVEGDGEVECARKLLERIWYEIVGGEYIDVLKPIRRPRSKLLMLDGQAWSPRPDEIARALEFAAKKLCNQPMPDTTEAILILIDADQDCPKTLAPAINNAIPRGPGRAHVRSVLANTEYETWFVAAAESLVDHWQIPIGVVPEEPEAQRCGKGWIKSHLPGYSETLDQIRLTAQMDLTLCRKRSPSFDKLCREMESLATASRG